MFSLAGKESSVVLLVLVAFNMPETYLKHR